MNTVETVQLVSIAAVMASLFSLSGMHLLYLSNSMQKVEGGAG